MNDQDTVRHLTEKQQFDGSWDFDTNNSQVLVSAIVVVMLERRFASFSLMWHGVVQKVRKRLLDLLGNDVKKRDALLDDLRKQL